MEKKIKLMAVGIVGILVVASLAVVLMSGNSFGTTNNGQAKTVRLQNSTAFGNLNNETLSRCATNGNGDLFVIGYTDGAETNITGGYDSTFNGERDIIILKYSSDLSTLLGSTYLGGSKDDFAYGLKIGNNEKVYVMGWTNSLDFPCTTDAFNKTITKQNIFISQLSSDLKFLEHSTFLGDGNPEAMVIAVDGDVLIAGSTDSPAFPTTTGAFNRTLMGEDDAFIARFSPDLSTLKSSTLFGGPSYESAHSMAIDAAGHVYVAGETFGGYDEESGARHAPVTSGTFSSNITGPSEGYIAEFSSDLGGLIACTLIGGSGYDNPLVIGVAKDGGILVSGSTHSDNFPMTADAMNANHRDPIDSFICKLSPDLRELRYSTFLSLGVSYFSEMAEGSDGRIYLSSTASSLTSTIYTTKDAISSSFGGFNSDGFVTILDAKMTSVVYASYIGGNRDEESVLCLGPDGSFYVAGRTGSTDFPSLEDSGREQDNGYWGQTDGYILLLKFV